MVEFVKSCSGRYWRKDIFRSFIVKEKDGARFVVACVHPDDLSTYEFRYEDWFARRRPQRVEVVGHVGTHRVADYEQ